MKKNKIERCISNFLPSDFKTNNEGVERENNNLTWILK